AVRWRAGERRCRSDRRVCGALVLHRRFRLGVPTERLPPLSRADPESETAGPQQRGSCPLAGGTAPELHTGGEPTALARIAAVERSGGQVDPRGIHYLDERDSEVLRHRREIVAVL